MVWRWWKVVWEAAGRRNDDDSRLWRDYLFFSSSVQSPRSQFFSSLSVLSYFSSPSLVLLAVGNANEVQASVSLYFSSSQFSASSSIFWTMMVLSGVTGRNGGGDGGGYVDHSRLVLPLLSPVVEERFTIPCTSTGHGGRGMGLLPFVMVGRHGSPVFSINEGMGCVSS
uniref:Uncharacterized protein n=1 Tax=Populus alba TaxID=43335 RepID=A0A4U5QD48_POPAL|nr:hypothetical protein D5086_0000104220 [Populus alba]